MNIAFSILFGCYTALGTILSPLLEPLEYTSGEIGIIGGVFIISGVVASIIVGALLGKNRKFLRWLRLISFISAFALMALAKTAANRNLVPLTINTVVAGFFLIPIIPCGFAFSVELTHPVDPSLVNGIMMMGAQTTAFLLSIG